MSTVLITGASSGIGLELAKVFAAHEFNLIIVARSEDKLKNLKKEIQQTHDVEVKVIVADLAETNAAENLTKLLKNEQIDQLVNNAGFGDYGEFAKADLQKLEQMINLNILTLTKLTQLLLPKLEDSHQGRIMNVASTAAIQPVPYFTAYAATKAYVLSFSEGLAHELEPKNISVTALCPGATTSGFQKGAEMENSGFMRTQKFATAKEVAQYGYHSMQAGKRVAIHGTLNNLLASATRLLPRTLVTRLSALAAK